MRSKSIISTIVWVLIALIIIALVAGLIIYTKGFTTDFQSFYIVVNGERVLENGSGYKINGDRHLDVDVKYVFGRFSKEASGYSVKVVPADNVNFEIKIDDVPKDFEDIEDLAGGFNLKLEEEKFTLSPKGNLTKLLSYVYDGAAVSVPDDMAQNEDEIFKLIVTSYNGKQSVEITFGILYFVAVEGVTLPIEVWL